jgi:hypothetical protein
MNDNNSPVIPITQNDRKNSLKAQVQNIITSQNLENQRRMINAIAAELKTSVLDCAAAIAYLHEDDLGKSGLINTSQTQSIRQSNQEKPPIQSGIRLVRYRLDLGNQHNVTMDEIKKVLVDESGVDIKNIANVRIQDGYTLIDLPDEMPQEIFHHLKTIEINGQKLDIRRVKPRNKKRGNRGHRRMRPDHLLSAKEG